VTSFLDQTLTAFLDEAAARQPAPGGGSAAGLTVALSAGLTAMAARFSAPQVKDSEAHYVSCGSRSDCFCGQGR
jgi:formiminotetrahydrofolate cyclodeaminase